MLYRPVSTDSHFIDEETEAERMGAIACFKIQGIREWYKTSHPWHSGHGVFHIPGQCPSPKVTMLVTLEFT